MGKDGRAASKNFDLFVAVISGHCQSCRYFLVRGTGPGVNRMIINRSAGTFFVELISRAYLPKTARVGQICPR